MGSYSAPTFGGHLRKLEISGSGMEEKPLVQVYHSSSRLVGAGRRWARRFLCIYVRHSRRCVHRPLARVLLFRNDQRNGPKHDVLLLSSSCQLECNGPLFGIVRNDTVVHVVDENYRYARLRSNIGFVRCTKGRKKSLWYCYLWIDFGT